MSAARKYAITLVFLTPEPSKDALPRKLITIASNKACFAIGDQNGNDAVLGTGSYKAGISAVGLTPKTDEGPGDVGTCMEGYSQDYKYKIDQALTSSDGDPDIR